MGNETGNGIVQIAYLHSEHVSHSWVESMRRMWRFDRLSGNNRIAENPLNLRCGSGMVAHTRNYGARLFLDKTPHEWMLFVDTDMGFDDDAVHRLLAVADPAERPVVGALCFALMEASYDGMGGWRRTIVPTMYKLGTTVETGEPSYCFYGPYVDDTVTPVAGTGTAFLLMHRSALEKLRAEYGDHWFDQVYDRAGDIIGEDIAFCGRLLKAGITPHVHTGVKTTHHKEIWLAEVDYFNQGTVVGPDVIHPELPLQIHLGGSFAALTANAHNHDGMLKFTDDLDRYAQIIAATKPEVLVETGTHTGASARWFESQGVEVITVDAEQVDPGTDRPCPTFVTGNSVDPEVVANVAKLVAGRRCMVSLDSDHSAAHVAQEIELYGPLVSVGCYLVVEDTIFGYAPDQLLALHGLSDMDGSPLDAVGEKLLGNPAWSRDIAIERSAPISQNPAGWWVRNG